MPPFSPVSLGQFVATISTARQIFIRQTEQMNGGELFMDDLEKQIDDATLMLGSQKQLADEAAANLPVLDAECYAEYIAFKAALDEFDIQTASRSPETEADYKNAVRQLRDKTQDFLTSIANLDMQHGQVKTVLKVQHKTVETVRDTVAAIIEREGITG